MSLSNLRLLITQDSEGNCCPRFLCTRCHVAITDARKAGVALMGAPQAVCDRCISALDDRALVVPLLDFLVCAFCNAGLSDLLQLGVNDELLPVLAE